MKREEALELAEAGYTELCRALQAGQSETLTRYLKVMATFHRYSFGNVMMIFRQFPKARQVAGFRAWERLGRSVKKGEKGIAIFAPLRVKKTVECDGGEATREVSQVVFRVVHVFDISQTEGQELDGLSTVAGDPGEAISAAKGLYPVAWNPAFVRSGDSGCRRAFAGR